MTTEMTTERFGVRTIMHEGVTYVTIHPKGPYRIDLDAMSDLESQRSKVAHDFGKFQQLKASGDLEAGTTFAKHYRVGWRELLHSLKFDGTADLYRYAEDKGVDLGVPSSRKKAKKSQRIAQMAKEVIAKDPDASHKPVEGIESMSLPDRLARSKKLMDQAESLNSVMWQGMRGDISKADCHERSVALLKSILGKSYDMLSALEK